MANKRSKSLICAILILILLVVVIWLPKERRMTVFLTGYSYWDNTPPASAIIGRPVIHTIPAGIGTYDDPVTLAVGWRIDGSEVSEDFPPGTRFYIPRLRKYAIVEDLCGDGAKPQGGPCHVGWAGYPWLDIYVDGSTRTAEISQRCMEKLTGIQSIVETGCKVF